jgi:aspartyl-tRNA synthetase
MHRTHTCGELNISHVGQTVILCAWINKIRNMWGLVFIDLRDRYGITQITLDPAVVWQSLVDQITWFSNEYIVKVTGDVIARPDTMKNPDMITGEIEIKATAIELVSESQLPPFVIEDDPKTSEELRMKYRYLDLRRNPVRDNIIFRAKMNQFTRNWFSNNDFLEVQTPIFSVSSPEWARDYLIPSRVNPGQFYALPQAPQQYKQLLMVGGIDKYFQIAPCFRDEDPRADRHSCEFYQIDCEMSFVEQQDVYAIAESYIRDLIPTVTPHKQIVVDFHKLSYVDAMETYWSDKPDLRFDSKMIEVTSLFALSELDFLRTAPCIKAVVLHQLPTRKEIDTLTEVVKQAGLWWLAYIQIKDDGITGSIAGKLTEIEKETILTTTYAQSWDTIFFLVGEKKHVLKSWDKLRSTCRDMFALIDTTHLGFVWIEDFPFFEEDESKASGLEFAHNPFSNIKWGRETVKNTLPMERQTTQYDLTCNWYEILSGSIRNHDPEILLKVFETAWYALDDIKKRFWTMYEALQYGCPPHGGFAFWFDRLMMILRDEPNIRECYAFPKSGRAQDVMMNAPSVIDPEELKVLGVKTLV